MFSKIIANGKAITVDILWNDKEHRQGLMGQLNPRPTLFVFKEAKPRQFWMKNCPAPLDIYFIKDDQIISHATGIPFSEILLGPNEPVNFVLEVPFSNQKLKGDIDIKYSLSSVAKLF